jgi:hypothetical protein
MQIPDTFMISSTGGNFGHWHDLMGISIHRVVKPVRLPILHQCGKNPDMRAAYPRIMLDGIKEARYRFAHFHN